MSTKTEIVGVGRDIDLVPGEVAETVAIGHSEDKCGHVFRLAGGGVLIVTFAQGAREDRNRTRSANHVWDEPTRAKVAAVLDAWAGDPEFRGRDHHAAAHGICPRMVSVACDHRADRAAPPMGEAYAAACLRRKRRQNDIYKRPKRRVVA